MIGTNEGGNAPDTDLVSRLRADLWPSDNAIVVAKCGLLREAADTIERLSTERERRRADETAWLIEENAGGVIHWIALRENIWRRGWYIRPDDEPTPTPFDRVKDANEALRFSRKQDAEAFIALFSRFLLCAIATEHCWPTIDQARTLTNGADNER